MKTGLLFLLAMISSAQDFDVLIRGGRIVDGTGNPAYHGDLAIRQGVTSMILGEGGSAAPSAR